MRIIRDIGRHKARKRRYEKSEKHGLITILLHNDDDSTQMILEEMLQDDSMDIITEEELSTARGGKEDPRLWLGVLGYVFDVSAGYKFYGEGGEYHSLTGRDATMALSRGDLSLKDESWDDVEGGLGEKDMAEARRWLEYFVSHDKYVRVGRLPNKDDVMVDLDELLEKDIEEEEEKIRDLSDEGTTTTTTTATDVEEDGKLVKGDNKTGSDEKKPPEGHPNVVGMQGMACPGGG